MARIIRQAVQSASAIVVDVGARVVRREGVDVHLAPKAFDLLVILIRNQPNAVPHEQLHNALWPGVHVSETSLAARQLILPVFVAEGISEPRPIGSMPGVVQHTLDTLRKARLPAYGEVIGRYVEGKDGGSILQVDRVEGLTPGKNCHLSDALGG